MKIQFTIGFIAPLMLIGCQGKTQTETKTTAAQTFAENFQMQLLDAKPGDVITVPEGIHEFDRSLSLNVDGVTIRGTGMYASILSFKKQVSGAEGLLVTASDFTLEHLAIENTNGDALKVNEGNNIIIRGVRAEWTGGPSTKNGAYGLYPVQTTNVLMEDNVAIGASDAGIYVGQSKNVIVRRNRAEFNVAGIEIENTIDADVYENVATNNTGGILVFNMPALSQEGRNTRIFNNRVFENNYKNFGHKGTPVASIPAGSGVLVNSNDYVEIFDNEIANHKTANLIVSSVYSTNYSKDENTVSTYDPYPDNIFIHGNSFTGGGNSPDGLDLKALKVALFGLKGNLPDILWDGYADPDGSAFPICVDNGDVQILNADGPAGYKAPGVMTDGREVCTLEPLPKITLNLDARLKDNAR